MKKCSNCGLDVNDNQSFCPNCGNKLSLDVNNNQTNVNVNNQSINQNNMNVNNQQSFIQTNTNQTSVNQPVVNQSNQVNDNIVNNNVQSNANNTETFNINNNTSNENDDLINAFIGDKADKIRNDSLSLWTLLFGDIYFLYRKMWLYAFIWMVIQSIASICLSTLGSLISLVLNVVLAFKFRDIYLHFVSKKVEKIKLNNANKSHDEIKSICAKKGGTSKASVIIVCILLVVVCLLIGVGVVVVSQYINQNMNTNSTENLNTIDKVKIIVPDFFDEPYTSKSFKRYETNLSYSNSCVIYLNEYLAKSYDNNVDNYLKEKVGLEDVKINQEDINGVIWSYTAKIDESSTHIYAATLYNNVIYTFTYDIYSDEDEKCVNAFEDIIKSLRLE